MRSIRILGSLALTSTLACNFACNFASASDWPRFRGPNGSGVSLDAAPAPEKWSPDDGVKWKVALPGAGVSCPIVVGDRIFVTCYTGYGVDRGNPGDQKDLKRHLVCIDRKTGQIAWTKTVDAVLPEDPFAGAGVPEHGYASHTAASDGQRVYAFFGKSGVYAYDLEGKELWHANVGKGSDPRRWGSSSSPIIYQETVIVPAGPESGAIVGLDTATGQEKWRAESESLGNVWGTPVAVPVSADRTDIVIGAPYEIWAINPSNGKLKWYCEAMPSDQFNSSVVAGDGVVYAIEGRGGGSIAVKAGGSGDVTKDHVVWSGGDSSRFGTPVVYEGRIYFFNGGVANCIDAATGDKIFQSRLRGGRPGGNAGEAGRGPGGPGGGQGGPGGGPGGRRGFGGGSDYSSPVLTDGKVYYTTRGGETYVLKAGREFEQLAVNRVTDDTEVFSATPAISNGELFLRSDKHLYCVGAK
ncbi:PQQ-binding-like beta-propeller repeat protein [Planctomyces sp. SH-PL14]|uniref:outer membrane protein assembly factor BamB family protein n=1 Tax=Planctomyces sp. SH-PL14 TaxID=1632864 RepID=UPI00078CF1CC|nr:PQQ-binding-like beta-propeller repeat protein [Planctomyces sp. SH-PL14]AMV18808.1 outer membrane biogenesis protein BamB [Planctomyces sp. SH-PL14]